MHPAMLLAVAGSLVLSGAEPVRSVPSGDTAAPARVISPMPVARSGKACAPLSRHAIGERGRGARKLIDAPPADLHLAVDRRVEGCPVPALAGTRPR